MKSLKRNQKKLKKTTMIEVKKRENESSLNLIKRFGKKVKQSSNLKLVRKLRFKSRPKSKLRKKEDALKREAYRKKSEYLYKLGKID